MSDNTHAFRRIILDFQDALETDMVTVAQNLCFVLAENVIIGGRFGNPTGTPVQYGFARGQWTPSLDTPVPQSAAALDPLGSTALGRATATASSLALGETFWLSNGADYINALENGHSQQAPLGMVGPVLANAQQLADYVVENSWGMGTPTPT